MNANPKTQPVTRANSRPASAEQRLKELHIELPAPPGHLEPMRKMRRQAICFFWPGCSHCGS